MTFKAKALGLALAAGSLGLALPVAAQQPAPKPVKLSEQASPAIIKLQDAVKANNFAAVPGLVAQANAKAKTADDRYAIAALQARAAQAQKDNAGLAAAIDAMVATGRVPANEVQGLNLNAAQARYELKQYDQAATRADQVLAADPNNVNALLLLSETRIAQNRPGDAVPLLAKAIQLRAASGQKAPEGWYNRAAALAFNNKLPSAAQLARDWAKAYPSAESWRAAILAFEPASGLKGDELLDLYRLQRAAGAMKSDADYGRYANIAMRAELHGEAKAVLDEGFAANAINRNKPDVAQFYAAAGPKATTGRTGLATAERTALASGAARSAMAAGDAHMSYGEYGKAASLYRAALGKSGVDAGLTNLRLGIALARAGDTAGATAAFNAVTGPRAGLAKLWADWLGSRR